jgi:hypothetical protein
MAHKPWLLLATFVILSGHARAADAFDLYTNTVLSKAAEANALTEVKELTPELLAEHARLLPQSTGALIVVKTNEGRFAKLLAEPARQKVSDDVRLPILLIERFTTFKEGEERAVQASGSNVHLYQGFRFNLDFGQVVPAAVPADLEFADAKDKPFVIRPVGKAKLYIVTKPLPDAAPKKGGKLVVGEAFETRYFNGTYQLFDDGRRSGRLELKVNDAGDVTGSFYSDKDGAKYDVAGKVGPAKHAVSFTVQFPRVEQTFQGFLFTGNAKAICGSSKLQEREAGFYAVRVEDD